MDMNWVVRCGRNGVRAEYVRFTPLLSVQATMRQIYALRVIFEMGLQSGFRGSGSGGSGFGFKSSGFGFRGFGVRGSAWGHPTGMIAGRTNST